MTPNTELSDEQKAVAWKLAQADELHQTLCDARSGWRYIRETHGDLYGVGWDRVERRLDAQIEASAARIKTAALSAVSRSEGGEMRAGLRSLVREALDSCTAGGYRDVDGDWCERRWFDEDKVKAAKAALSDSPSAPLGEPEGWRWRGRMNHGWSAWTRQAHEPGTDNSEFFQKEPLYAFHAGSGSGGVKEGTFCDRRDLHHEPACARQCEMCADSQGVKGEAFTWPAKSCPCGDVQSAECQEHNCKWERDPSLVPVALRLSPTSPPNGKTADGVAASGEAQLLHEAHDQLHRLAATFVPGNDGAYTETTDLMRRIREALPGVAFDGGSDGMGGLPDAQP